jgi:hypothetical protein
MNAPKGQTLVLKKIADSNAGRTCFEVVPDHLISSQSQNPKERGSYLTVVVERHFRVTPVETFKVEDLN